MAISLASDKKNAEMHKIFSSLPESETLIDDFSCALKRDVLIQGRLYLTQNWLCFYANILSFETVMTIPFKSVQTVTKEMTAMVIPNAIKVTTTKEKYRFSSLLNRDVCHGLIVKVWKKEFTIRGSRGASVVVKPPASEEYKKMLKYFSTIISQLAAARCSGELADKLRGRGLITDGVYEEATNGGAVESARIRSLMTAVHAKVEINAASYHKFMVILREITGLEDIVQLLKGENKPQPKHS